MSSASQVNGMAVTTAAPPEAVAVEFPEMVVATTGAVVIARELDAPAALLSVAAVALASAAAPELDSASVPELALAAATSRIVIVEV